MKPKRKSPAKRIERATVPTAPTPLAATSESDASALEYYNNYAEYSKTLRAWLVAYGIGGPILFLTNSGVAETLSKSQDKAKVICLFLLGVSLQVLLAFINKWCAWHMYAGENDSSYTGLLRYRFWLGINSLSILDFFLDAVSIAVFVWATWLVLMAFI
ncbi:MAG: hypothetical protein ACTHLV_09380 [Achromobacter mucicolens]